MLLDHIIPVTIFIALVLYGLTGGADYGAGVWDFLAYGEDKKEHREIITMAIKPIWEADHVWLILIVVLLFTAYPPAFAFICLNLNIPLSLMLIGIVLRGAGFVFRTYDDHKDRVQERWSFVFAAASTGTPILLGMLLGAISSGKMHTDEKDVYAWLIAPWTTPYCILLGFMTLSLFAFLAAVYLTVDTHEKPKIQERFRKNALASQLVIAVMSGAVLSCSKNDAPRIFDALTASSWHLEIIAAVGITIAVVVYALLKSLFRVARIAAVLEAVFILTGFALAEYPYVVPPSFTITNCAASRSTMELLVVALAAGAVLLFPGLFLLYRIFKGPGEHSTLGTPLD